MDTLDVLQILKNFCSNYIVTQDGVDIYHSNNLEESLYYMIEQKKNSKKTKFELKINKSTILSI